MIVYNAYFVKSTPLTAFVGSFQNFAHILQTYWKCPCETLIMKKLFLHKMTALLTFMTTALSQWWLIVYTFLTQLLLYFSLDLPKTLHICNRHIEYVHVQVWCWKFFFGKWQDFLLSLFMTTALSQWWLIVHTLWNQFLLELLFMDLL